MGLRHHLKELGLNWALNTRRLYTSKVSEVGLQLVYLKDHLSLENTRLESWVGLAQKALLQCLAEALAPSSPQSLASVVWEAGRVRKLSLLS